MIVAALCAAGFLAAEPYTPVVWIGTPDAAALDAAVATSAWGPVWKALGGGALPRHGSAARAPIALWGAWFVRSLGSALPLDDAWGVWGTHPSPLSGGTLARLAVDARLSAGDDGGRRGIAGSALALASILESAPAADLDPAALGGILANVLTLYGVVARTADGRDAAARLQRWGLLGLRGLRGGLRQGDGGALRVDLALDDRGPSEGVLGALAEARPALVLQKPPRELSAAVRIVLRPEALWSAVMKLWAYDAPLAQSLWRAALDNAELHAQARWSEALGVTAQTWTLLRFTQGVALAAEIDDGEAALRIARALVSTLPSLEPSIRVETRVRGEVTTLVVRQGGRELGATTFTPQRLLLASSQALLALAQQASAAEILGQDQATAVVSGWHRDAGELDAALGRQLRNPTRTVAESLAPGLADSAARQRARAAAQSLKTQSTWRLWKREGGWQLTAVLGALDSLPPIP